MSDFVSGKKSDYTKGALNRMFCNWGDVEVATQEPLILYRWDMELAIECLDEEDRKTVFTVIAFGESALKCGAVSEFEWGTVLQRLYSILNNEGLVRKNNAAEVRLATEKSRPFTVLEMATGRDLVYG